jgi:hypothetical protein
VSVFDVGAVQGTLLLDDAPLLASTDRALASLRSFGTSADTSTATTGRTMGANLSEGVSPFALALDKTQAKVREFAAVAGRSGKEAGDSLSHGLTAGLASTSGAIADAVTGIDRLGASAVIAGAQAEAAMAAYTAAAERAAAGTAPINESLDVFAARAVTAAATASDAVAAYAVAAERAGAQGGAGLAEGIRVGAAEADASMAKSTELVKGLAGGLLAGFAIGGAMEFFKDAAKAAQADVNGAYLVKKQFGEASEVVQKFSENAATSFGMSAGAANAAAAKMGAFLDSFKIGQAQAAEMSVKLVGLSADIAKFRNADPAAVELAIQTALKGRATAMLQFGVNVSTAAVQQEALTEGLIKQGGHMDATTKAIATYNLIVKDSADKNGTFAASGNLLSTQQQQLTANLENFAGRLGEAVMPALAALGNILVHVIVPGIEAIFTVIQPVITAFDNLPGPIQNVVAGLGILLLLKSPLTSMFGALTTGFLNFKNNIANIKEASAAANTSLVATGTVAETTATQVTAMDTVLADSEGQLSLFGGTATSTAAELSAVGLAADGADGQISIFAGEVDSLTTQFEAMAITAAEAAVAEEGVGLAADAASVGIGTMGAVAELTGAAIKSAFGPVMIIIGLVTAAMFLFTGSNNDAAKAEEAHAAEVSALGDTLNKLTGNLTAASAVKIDTDWIKNGTAKQFTDVAGGAAAVAAAIVEGGPAIDEMRQKLQNGADAGKTFSLAMGDAGLNLQALGAGSGKAVGGTNALIKAAGEGETAMETQANAIAKAGGSYDDSLKTMQAYAAGLNDATPGLEAFNTQVDASNEAQKTAKDVIAGTAAASADLAAQVKATDQMMASTPGADAASTASIDYSRSMSGVASELAVVQDKLPMFGTALQTVADNATAATTANDLFMGSLDALAGKSISAKLAADTNASAIRGIGAAARASAQAQADLVKAQDAAITAEKGYVVTQADADAANAKAAQSSDALTKSQLALTKAENSSKTTRSQLSAAQASVTLAQQKNNKAQADAATTTANVGKQIKGTTAYDVAYAAAVRGVADAQDKVKASQEAVDTANKAAADSARTVVASTFEQTLASKGSKAALDAGTKAMDAQRKAFIDAQPAADQLSGAAKRLADQEGLIPKKVTTAFEGDIKTAAANGQTLYRTYSKLTGQWTAEFLTAGDAAAKAKAGATLQAYQPLKNSFSATFTADGTPAVAVATATGTALTKVAQDKYYANIDANDFASAIADAAKAKMDEVSAGQYYANIDANDLASSKVAEVQAAIDSLTGKTVEVSLVTRGSSYIQPSTGNQIVAGYGHAATGGRISGAGTGTSDSIPTMLSNGEFVMNAKATEKNLPLLHAMNAQHFANGGQVTSHVNMTGTGNVSNATGNVAAFYGVLDAAAKAAAAASATAATVASGAIPMANGAGTEQWRALADKVAAAKGENIASVQVMLNQMSRESSGNPAAINLTDSNAMAGHPSEGLLQFIQGTFDANADPGFNSNIWDPESQMHAWYNYINKTYGGYVSFGARGYGAYASGGLVTGPGTGTSDSIPAMLSNHEFVSNASATKKNRKALEYINSGGVVPGFALGGYVSGGQLAGNIAPNFGPRENNVFAGLTSLSTIISDAHKQLFTLKTTQAADRALMLAADKKMTTQQLKDQASVARAERLANSASLAAGAKHASASAQVSAQNAALSLKAARATMAANTATNGLALHSATAQFNAAKKATDQWTKSVVAVDKNNTAMGKLRLTQISLSAAYDRTAQAVTNAQMNAANARTARSGEASNVAGIVSGYDSGILGHLPQRTDINMLNNGLAYDLAKEKTFKANLAKARANGVNSGLLKQVAEAGIDGGGQVAAELAGASRAQIRTTNSLEAQITTNAAGTGALVASAVYDKQIASLDRVTHAAQALLNSQDALLKKIGGTLATELNGISVRLDPSGLARLVAQGNKLVTRRA